MKDYFNLDVDAKLFNALAVDVAPQWWLELLADNDRMLTCLHGFNNLCFDKYKRIIVVHDMDCGIRANSRRKAGIMRSGIKKASQEGRGDSVEIIMWG